MSDQVQIPEKALYLIFDNLKEGFKSVTCYMHQTTGYEFEP